MSKLGKDLLAPYQERIKRDRLAPSEGGCVELTRLAHQKKATRRWLENPANRTSLETLQRSLGP